MSNEHDHSVISSTDKLLSLSPNQLVQVTGEALYWIRSLLGMKDVNHRKEVTFDTKGGGGFVVDGQIEEDPLTIYWG